MESKKVYVVTSGEYSDYSIVGVCSTRDNAEKMVVADNARSMFCDARIEEYELDMIRLNGEQPPLRDWQNMITPSTKLYGDKQK